MRRQNRAEHGRGLGPFTGGQLTIIIVAVCAVFALPTAALAAAGAFSNNSATVPAVQGRNTNAKGVGVQGTGKKFGVVSNGPLGVNGPLSCNGCVHPKALASKAKGPLPLGTDESQSGVYSAAAGDSTDGWMVSTITFTRPMRSEPTVVYATTWPVAHCSGPGHADRNYLCLYVQGENNASLSFSNVGRIPTNDGLSLGATIAWNVEGVDAYVQGLWTVTSAG
jgi:hypothetical protein